MPPPQLNLWQPPARLLLADADMVSWCCCEVRIIALCGHLKLYLGEGKKYVFLRFFFRKIVYDALWALQLLSQTQIVRKDWRLQDGYHLHLHHHHPRSTWPALPALCACLVRVVGNTQSRHRCLNSCLWTFLLQRHVSKYVLVKISRRWSLEALLS